MTPEKMAQIILKDPVFSEVTSEVQEARLFKVLAVTKQSEGLYSVSARLTVPKYGDPPQVGGGGGGGMDGEWDGDGTPNPLPDWVEPPVDNVPPLILSSGFSELIYSPEFTQQLVDGGNDTTLAFKLTTQEASRVAPIGVMTSKRPSLGAPEFPTKVTLRESITGDAWPTFIGKKGEPISTNFEARRPFKSGSFTLTAKICVLENIPDYGELYLRIYAANYILEMRLCHLPNSSTLDNNWYLENWSSAGFYGIRLDDVSAYLVANAGKVVTVQLIFDWDSRYLIISADGKPLSSVQMNNAYPSGHIGLELRTPAAMISENTYPDVTAKVDLPFALSHLRLENGVHVYETPIDPTGDTVIDLDFKEMTFNKAVTDAFKPTQFLGYTSPARVISRTAPEAVIYTNYSADPETNKLMVISVPAIKGSEVLNLLSPRQGQGMMSCMDARRPLIGGSLVITAKMGFLQAGTSGTITIGLNAANFTFHLNITVRQTGSILTSQWTVGSGIGQESVSLPMVLLENLSEYLRANYGKLSTVKVIFDGGKKLCTITADDFIVAQTTMTHPYVSERMGVETQTITQLLSGKPEVTAQALYPCVLASLKLENKSESVTLLPPLPPPVPPVVSTTLIDVAFSRVDFETVLTEQYMQGANDVYSTPCAVASRTAPKAISNVLTNFPVETISLPYIKGGSVTAVKPTQKSLFNPRVEARTGLTGGDFMMTAEMGFLAAGGGNVNIMLSGVGFTWMLKVAPSAGESFLINRWNNAAGTMVEIGRQDLQNLSDYLMGNLGKIAVVKFIANNSTMRFTMLVDEVKMLDVPMPEKYPAGCIGAELKTPLQLLTMFSDSIISITDPCILAKLKLENLN